MVTTSEQLDYRSRYYSHSCFVAISLDKDVNNITGECVYKVYRTTNSIFDWYYYKGKNKKEAEKNFKNAVKALN